MKKTFILLIMLILLSSSLVNAANPGTRQNPYEIGQEFIVKSNDWLDGNLKFKVNLLEVKRGENAYQFLKGYSEWNANNERERADKLNKELLVARFFLKAVDIEKEYYEPNSQSIFEVVDSTGKSSDIINGTFTDEPFSGHKLYPGGELTGWITLAVNKNDSSLISVNVGDSTIFVNPNIGEEKKLVNLTVTNKIFLDLIEKANKSGLDINQYINQLVVKDLT